MARIKNTASKRKRGDERENDDVPAAKRITYDFTDMITILVGEEEHRFTVHKDMLCAKSKFFRAACSDRWASGVEKVVRQPEGVAEDFQIYVEWVYTSKISLHIDEVDKQQAKLMDMYILGDVVDDYQLRNASMRRLIANTRKEMTTLTSRQVHKVYDATTTGSPLRKFIVNWLLSSFDRGDLRASIVSEPAEFVRELALAALQRIEHEDTDEVFETLTRMFEPEKESG